MPRSRFFINKYRFSLAQEYLYFTAVILFLIIASSVLLLYHSFKKFENERHLLLYHQAQTIQMFFDERIMCVEHVLQFIGTKIANDSNQNIENLAKVLRHHRNNFNNDAFSWNMFTMISPELELVAESLHGLRDEPFKIDIARRSWINQAKEDFWHLHFSKPDIALISGDYILPAGISIPNKDKAAPAWYLASGVSLEKITKRLLQVIDKSVSFIIIDNSLNVITSSEPEIFSRQEKMPAWLANYTSSPHTQLMYKTLSIGEFDYFYSSPSEKYPFMILVGQDRKTYRHLLRDDLLPRIVIYICVGMVFALIMSFLGHQIIRPLMIFSRCADAISKERQVAIPRYPQKELSILGSQLEKLGEITRDLRTKQTQLSKINNELQNANSFIKSNMSFLSHELTNPISSILGFAQLLKKKLNTSSDTQVKEFIDIIEKTSIHQQKQLDFFLRLFRFQGAPKKIEKKEIDLKQVIEWNVSMIRHHANRKNLKIEIQVESNLKMMGDEIMVGQLIQNLAANAAKYNTQGGKIIIKAYSRYANQVAIDFADTGTGIAQEDISKIFRKFIRIKNNEKKKTIGYGIGLAYAKRCALLHGGKILVRSKLGVGSTFTAILQKE